MTIIKYKSLQELQQVANDKNIDLFQCDVSYSFRVFKNRQTIEFHVFYTI